MQTQQVTNLQLKIGDRVTSPYFSQWNAEVVGLEMENVKVKDNRGQERKLPKKILRKL